MIDVCQEFKTHPHVLEKRHRIIVIGDIHGDLEYLKKSLRIAKVIDTNNIWTGGDTCVVQLGDQIDSCRPSPYKKCTELQLKNDVAQDIAVINFMDELDKQSEQFGGLVISLLGNHELMNLFGDYSYVSNGNLHHKEENLSRQDIFNGNSKFRKKLICTHPSCVVIGSNLFVHAGMLPHISKSLMKFGNNAIDAINHAVRLLLLSSINKKYLEEISKDLEEMEKIQQSMFWQRIFGSIPTDAVKNMNDCEQYVQPVLDFYHVNHLIVGHTPQYIYKEGVNGTCNNKLWRVDIGGSQSFDIVNGKNKQNEQNGVFRNAQVLEILDDEIFNVLAWHN